MKTDIYQTFSLGNLLTKSSRMVMRLYETRLSEIDTSPLQGGVLYTIFFLKNPSQNEIAELLFINKVSLSKIILSLEQKSLIELDQSNLNRREKRWLINEKGKKLLSRIGKIDKEVSEIISNFLPVKDSEMLTTNLRSFITTGFNKT